MDDVLFWTFSMIAAGLGIRFTSPSIGIDYLCIAVGNMLFYIRCYKIMLQVDAVTRLLNRRCYDVQIADLGTHAAILLFDVDKFKEVNDTYGHSVGDLCLKKIAQELRRVYGKYGLCYRIGGDEFSVILRENLQRVEELNDRFTAAIKALRAEDSRIPDVSVGYAYYDADSTHIQKTIEEADAMLYNNKNI